MTGLPNRHAALFFANAFGFNVTYGLITLLVPLYALDLGYSALEIGVVVSVIGYVQLVARVSGGVLADWLGERRILFVSSGSMAFAGGAFLFGHLSIWPLVLGQVLSGLGRSCFWSPAQSYASRMDPLRIERNTTFFSAITSGGYLLGVVLAGILPAVWGFQTALATFTVLATVSTALWFSLREIPRTGGQSANLGEAVRGLLEVARLPPLYMSGLCAFMAATATSLAGSFYPIYMREVGMVSFFIGFAVASRNLGGIGGSFFWNAMLARLDPRLFTGGLIGLFGASLAVVYWIRDPLVLTISVLVTGFFSGGLNVYNVTLAGRHSDQRRRGVAMSFTGLFWSLALVIAPLSFGWITDRADVRTAFLVGGSVICGVGLLAAFLHGKLIPTDASRPVSAAPEGRVAAA